MKCSMAQFSAAHSYKGGFMKKHYPSMLLTLTCFLGLGVGAEGEAQREVVMTVPYEFVAGGKTLPAGTYTVTRVSEDRFGGLIISSYETRSSVFVMPNEFKGYPANNTKVRFKQIGDVHFLSKIETANGAYNIPAPQSATMLAGVKQHGDMSASGTN
jgi:hypothetical protein